MGPMQHYGCLKESGLLSAGFCPNICAGWDGLVPGDWEKDFGGLITNSQDFSYLTAHDEGDGRVGQMVGVGGDPAWDQADQGGPSPKHNLWGKVKIPRTLQECYFQLMGVHMPQIHQSKGWMIFNKIFIFEMNRQPLPSPPTLVSTSRTFSDITFETN